MKSFGFLVCAILAFLAGLLTGYYFHQNHTSSEVSNHDEMFYHKMVNMDKNSEITFFEFPHSLRRLLHATAGDKILSADGDTLTLICCYPNQADSVNRYPFYVMKDNRDNLWSLFHYEDGYHLYKEDETIHADWLTFQKQNAIQ